MISASNAPPPAAGDRLVGRLINGKFKVHAVIASGGMGRIYRAEQLPLGRPVAVKVVRSLSGVSQEDLTAFNTRFFREASILAKLQHPNIVTIFDYGRIEGLEDGDERYFMAMEYLPGETLHQRMRTRGRLSVDETVRIAYDVCRGLRAAHLQGVVHRDLKPANVMLTRGQDGEEQIKLVDFGIVKLLENEEVGRELTQEGSFVGSPNYMAPEQASGTAVDERTDIYALGVILYHCVAGKLPYEAPTSLQMVMAHLNSPVIPFATRAPGVVIPEWFSELVLQCLEKEPERRPPSLDEVLRIIYERSPNSGSGWLPPIGTSSPRHVAAVGISITDTGTANTLTATAARSRRSVATIAGGAVVGSLVALGVVVLLARGGRPGVAASHAPSVALSAVPAPATTASVRKSFVLVIDSTPSGADVIEGDEALGTTPLQITLDNEAVRTKSRKIAVRKLGFQPYSFVQGPSDDNVRVVAMLVDAPIPVVSASAPVAIAHPPSRPVPTPTPTPTSRSTAAPPPRDLDIRLTR